MLRGVATIGRGPTAPCAKSRGTIRAFADAGVPFDCQAIHRLPSTLDEARRVASEILGAADRPTALICHTDYLAIGAMRAAADLGLSIPRDLSVAGFNDIELGRFLPVTLTTISHDKDEAAAEMVDRVMERLSGGAAHQSRPSRVRFKLMLRESCAPPHHV